MKCTYCGKNNKPGAVVCKRCGIGLPPDPSVSEDVPADRITVLDHDGKKVPDGTNTGSKKGLIIAIAVIMAVLALAIAIFVLTRPGNITLPGKNAYTVNGTGVVYGGEPIVPETTRIALAEASLDGSRAGMLCENGSLYNCFKGENAMLAKDVTTFTVSSDGKHIVYLDRSGMLWSADCSKAGIAPISITNEKVRPGFAVSPDGETVIFNKLGDTNLYLYNKGNVKPIAENMAPVAAANGAKFIYAYSISENALYSVSKKGKTAFIRSNIGETLYVNSAHDEVVFSTEAGEGIVITMLTVKGKEPVELYNSNAVVAPVLPVSANVSSSTAESELAGGDLMWSYNVVTCPFRSFNGVIFDGGALVKYVKKAGAVMLDAKPCTAAANDKYNTVLYNADGNLFSRNLKSESADSIASGCVEFKVSADGKTVWYLDGSSALKHVYKGAETLIANGVEEFEILPNGKEAMFRTNGGVYLNKGGNVKKTFVFEGVSTYDIISDAKGFYILLSSGDWKKLEEGGKKIDLLG